MYETPRRTNPYINEDFGHDNNDLSTFIDQNSNASEKGANLFIISIAFRVSSNRFLMNLEKVFYGCHRIKEEL